jgi:alpha-mannosidase
VVAEAACFNAPLRPGPGLPSFASVDDPNLVLDTIKRAEDSDAVVLRLYEAHGARGTARLRVASDTVSLATARLASALEEDGDALEVENGLIVLPYRPHQVLTVKVG